MRRLRAPVIIVLSGKMRWIVVNSATSSPPGDSMKFRRILPALLFLASAPLIAADGGALAEQYCARCHGSDGVATSPGLPHLNGQLETYLTDAIGKLQKGRLPTTVATHIPSELSGSDLAAIVGHYSGIRATRPKQEVDPAKVARGEEVYRNRCAEC